MSKTRKGKEVLRARTVHLRQAELAASDKGLRAGYSGKNWSFSEVLIS